MKNRLLLLSLILGLALVPGLRAQDAAPKPAAAKEDTTELGDKMDKLSDAYKKLRKQIADASKNEDSLKLVAVIEAAAAEATKLIPDKAKDVPEADRAKFISDYQAKMKLFGETVAKLEAALKANDNAAAQKLLTDLGQQQKDGHREFRKKKPQP